MAVIFNGVSSIGNVIRLVDDNEKYIRYQNVLVDFFNIMVLYLCD